MKHAITIHPNKDLFQKTKDIPIKDIKPDTFGQIGSSMLRILRDTHGVGLSANQVGLTLNMCVIELTSNDPKIIINPRIIKTSSKMVASREGCLSLPGVNAKINRYEKVTVEYEDVTGKTIELEATGILSICIQHEMDHLKGILMINRLSEFHKSKALKQLYKFKKHNGKR